MTKIPFVSVIVVNWNGGEMFKQCLLSLSKIDYKNWELIVVDNGSKDGSDEYKFIRNKFKIIKNKKNLGFAAANNIGLQKSVGDYILFLNNDTIVPANLLKVLVARIQKDKGVGVVQPKIRFMDNPKLLDNVGSYLTWTGFLTHLGFAAKDSPSFDKERIIFAAKGACMLVRRDVVEKVGLFDDDFISYFEESDFCWRVWLAGFKVLYCPSVSIEHKVGFTSERLAATEVNYHSFKNRLSSLIKNLSLFELFKMLTTHFLIIEALSLYYLCSLKFSKFWMIQKAIWWNIKNIHTLLIKRKLVQKLRVVSDKELFKYILKDFSISKMFSLFKKVESNFLSKKIAEYDDTLEIGRIRECLSFIRSQKLKDKVFVDVGCSTGFVISKIAKEPVKKIIGIDPSKESIESARLNNPNVQFFISGADMLPIEDGSADVVTMFDVIEHVPKNTEREVFAEVKRVLKKNGKLLISTPNSNFLTNFLDPAWYFGHRHYKVSRIIKIIEKAGLKVRKTFVKGSLWSSIYMFWFYLAKWVFRKNNPRNTWLERMEDVGYNYPGIFTIFIEAEK